MGSTIQWRNGMNRSLWKRVTIGCLGLAGLVSANALQVEVGSEGHVVVCQDGQRQTTRLLDYFEGQRFKPLFPRHENYVYDKVRWSLTRVKSQHPELSKELLTQLKQMPNQVRFISGKGLGLGEGTRPRGLPLNCRSVKALFRSSGGNKKFTIRKDLWEKLPLEDQAGLVFHGLVADHFQEQGQVMDYAKVRAMVRLWSQGGPSSMGLSRYVYGLRGLEGLVKTVKINDLAYRLDPANPLRVYDNGQVAQGTMAADDKAFTYKAQQGFDLQISSKRGPVKLSFHETGVPRRALLQNEVVEIPVQGKKLKFKYEVSFHPNGQVERGFFLSQYGMWLKMSDGRFRRFKSMEYHMGLFDEDGRLISARRLSNVNKPLFEK